MRTETEAFLTGDGKDEEMKKVCLWVVGCFLLLWTVCFAQAESSLQIPVFTETDCEWDDQGRLIRETARTLEGEPALNARGFCVAEYTWEGDNPLTEAYYGLDGELVTIDRGYARAVFTYEKNSSGRLHILAEDRYAPDGSRAEIPGGYSYRRDTWNGDQILATEYFHADGSPALPLGGFSKILYDVEEDADTSLVSKTYQAADGSPLLGAEGGAKVVYLYAKGRDAAVNARVGNMNLGMLREGGREDGLMDGVAESDEERAFDAGSKRGNEDRQRMLLSTEIFGVDGSETLGANRWHRELRTYDSHGNLIRTDYTDAEGHPILAANGYASVVNTYDDQDRVVQIDYLDREGHLIKMLNGYARVTYEYYRGDLVHYVRFFGADGERTMLANGMSMIEREYDGGDWDLRETYYDTVDQYTLCNGGYARIEWKFDIPDHFTGGGTSLWETELDGARWMRNFGTDMKLIKRKAGYAGYENFRNAYGQIIRTVYMDENWQPTRNDEAQYAWIDYSYTGTSLEEPAAAEAYFDQDGNPCEGITGAYARSMV
ncbi:MAG: hypothetical protein K6A68_06315, partial [Clostridiales bacterium]|nr:hypothetical protein [Clostridiales bacterium]